MKVARRADCRLRTCNTSSLAAAAAAALGSSSSDDEDSVFISPGSTEAAAGLQEGTPLPGIPTTWAVNQSVPEVGPRGRVGGVQGLTGSRSWWLGCAGVPQLHVGRAQSDQHPHLAPFAPPGLHRCYCCYPQIHAVSKRLVQLHSLLGAGGDIDVIW
jgi:hypothetical protein